MPTTPISALTWPRPTDTHPSTPPCTARDPAGGSLLAFATGYVYRVGISSGVATRLPFPEGRPYAAAWQAEACWTC